MFCDLGDIQIHYERYGKGKPVVMIHGFTPDYRLMEGAWNRYLQAETAMSEFIWICREWAVPKAKNG